MREIEFRGWDIDNNQWVYGYYVKRQEYTPAPLGITQEEYEESYKYFIFQDGFSDWGLRKPWYKIDIDPDSVGQFTGVKDDLGKKIYEGDFLAEGSGRAEVEYHETEFIAMDVTDNHMCNMLSSNALVIGNKYENKEIQKCEYPASSTSDTTGTDTTGTTKKK